MTIVASAPAGPHTKPEIFYCVVCKAGCIGIPLFLMLY
jgi:hypothetical protein